MGYEAVLSQYQKFDFNDGRGPIGSGFIKDDEQ